MEPSIIPNKRIQELLTVVANSYARNGLFFTITFFFVLTHYVQADPAENVLQNAIPVVAEVLQTFRQETLNYMTEIRDNTQALRSAQPQYHSNIFAAISRVEQILQNETFNISIQRHVSTANGGVLESDASQELWSETGHILQQSHNNGASVHPTVVSADRNGDHIHCAPQPDAENEVETRRATLIYKLDRGVKTVPQLLEEWELGRGGKVSVIEANEKWGNEWRKNDPERKFYSRRLVIYRYVCERSSELNMTRSAMAARLEEYRVAEKLSLDKLQKNIASGTVML